MSQPKRLGQQQLIPLPPLKWDLPLQYRIGAEQRLSGIEVWYDFDWREVFPSKAIGPGKTQFRNGQRLALLVKEEAKAHAPGRLPALVLTILEVEEGPRVTETHYIVVVKIREYIRLSESDPAVGYFALRIKAAITAAGRLRHLVSDPGLFSTLMQEPDAFAAFISWARENTTRYADLSTELEQAGMEPKLTGSRESVVQALMKLERIDQEMLTALASALQRCSDRTAKLAILETITSDPEGREAVASMWGLRIAERLADAERIADLYDRMIRSPDVTETQIQAFIEGNPWLIGIEYARVRPRCNGPQGTMDFLLERFDGYHDLLELKSPNDPIVIIDGDDTEREGAPPPSSYRFSEAMAQALAQAHLYRHLLNRNEQFMRERRHILKTWEPRLLIVLGCWDKMSSEQQSLLDELNRSLHRVEIVPFDRLAVRARQILRNVEDCLYMDEFSRELLHARATPKTSAA